MKKKKPKKAAATDEEKRKEEHRQLHDTLIETLAERELSNSVSLDQAILAYSSGGLALSLTFLKDAVPFEESIYRPALYASWVGFILAIFAVIISFAVSQRGSKRQRDRAKRYYLDDDDAAFDEPNRWVAAVEYLNDSAAICFIIAVISATTFVYTNLDHKGANMTNDKNKPQVHGQVKPEDLHEGAPPPPLQQKSQQQQQGANKTDSGGKSGKK